MDPHNLALAYSLSTVAGLRASLTVVALSVAIHMHLLQPPDSFAWVGSNVTLVVVCLLAAADFFGDKIPTVDHALHLVHLGLAPLAGLVAAVTVDPSNTTLMTVVGVAGAFIAFAVHALRTTIRAGSSVLSFGALNPLISFAEDAFAFFGILLAFVAPFVVAAFAILTTIGLASLARRILRKRQHIAVAVAAEPVPRAVQ
jgi:uncharacterized membrane protein